MGAASDDKTCQLFRPIANQYNIYPTINGQNDADYEYHQNHGHAAFVPSNPPAALRPTRGTKSRAGATGAVQSKSMRYGPDTVVQLQ